MYSPAEQNTNHVHPFPWIHQKTAWLSTTNPDVMLLWVLSSTKICHQDPQTLIAQSAGKVETAVTSALSALTDATMRPQRSCDGPQGPRWLGHYTHATIPVPLYHSGLVSPPCRCNNTNGWLKSGPQLYQQPRIFWWIFCNMPMQVLIHQLTQSKLVINNQKQSTSNKCNVWCSCTESTGSWKVILILAQLFCQVCLNLVRSL